MFSTDKLMEFMRLFFMCMHCHFKEFLSTFDLEDEEKDKEEITESSHTTNQLDTISALLTILYQKSSNFQEWEWEGVRGRERGNVVTKGFSSNSVSRTSGNLKKLYWECAMFAKYKQHKTRIKKNKLITKEKLRSIYVILIWVFSFSV